MSSGIRNKGGKLQTKGVGKHSFNPQSYSHSTWKSMMLISKISPSKENSLNLFNTEPHKYDGLRISAQTILQSMVDSECVYRTLGYYCLRTDITSVFDK